MTKINNVDFATCRCCGKLVDVKNISSAYIREDITFSKCKVCSWLGRNSEKIKNINGYNPLQIRNILDFFYNQNGTYINDFANQENISINDAIKLYQILKIANVKCLIRVKCEYCNAETECSPSAYLSTKNHYCYYECYWKDKTNKMEHGEQSQFYNRIKTKCTNCGKQINKIPYSYKKKNSFGDNHNFCGYQCYWDYRRKYYIGEKSVNWQREFTEEHREKMAYTAVMNSRKTKTRETAIQLSINEILNKYNIRYEREYFLGNYMQIDNYLCDYNLMIEVQGDYWHVNPLKYNKQKRLINDTQVKDIIQDKRKHTMAKNKGIEILYLWEDDIKNNINLCESLILLYIKSNGDIENYNSFNWRFDNEGKLILSDHIVYSYHELPCEEYKEIIKKKAG